MQTQLYIYIYIYLYLADTEFSASILLCSECYCNWSVPLWTELDSQKNSSEQCLKKSGQSQQKQVVLVKSLVSDLLTEGSSLSLLIFSDLEKLLLQLQSKEFVWLHCFPASTGSHEEWGAMPSEVSWCRVRLRDAWEEKIRKLCSLDVKSTDKT